MIGICSRFAGRRERFANRAALIPEIEKTLLKANNGRNVEVQAISDIRRGYDSRDRAVVFALNALSFAVFALLYTGLWRT